MLIKKGLQITLYPFYSSLDRIDNPNINTITMRKQHNVTTGTNDVTVGKMFSPLFKNVN